MGQHGKRLTSPDTTPGNAETQRHHMRDGRVDTELQMLEIQVRRQLDGLLHGNHLGLVPGPGSEPGEARPYYVGDDVRRMDWAVTARTTQPHIRQTIADRELETWLAVDLSASMDFGTTTQEKRDTALAAAAAFAHLTRGGGNRLGAVLSSGAGVQRLPALGGRASVIRVLKAIATTPRSQPGQPSGIAHALESLRRPQRRRGLIIVISDFLGPSNWYRPLRALAARHQLIAVSITDPRDLSLPDVGLVTLTDPETGRTRHVMTTAALRARFATAAQDQQQRLTSQLRSLGAAQLRLSTDRDWIHDILRFVMQRKYQWSGSDQHLARRT